MTGTIPHVFRRHRSYLAFVTASIALSVGAPLAAFTVVNALWLKPLPVANADRLVVVMDSDRVAGSSDTWFGGVEDAAPWAAFECVAGQVISGGAAGALRPRLSFDAIGTDLEVVGVTSQYFQLLGLSI